jgi:hypothetical protein
VPRIAATTLRYLHGSVVVLIPCCYWLTGLYCLMSDFSWQQTIVLGVVHLLIFIAAQRVAVGYYTPMMYFACLIFLGLLTIMAAWIGWGRNIYRALPLAVVGSVAWAIVSWTCTAYLCSLRARKGKLRTSFPRITRADQFLVLAVPMLIAGIVGGIFAATNPDSRFLSERFEDFVNVGQLGVACGAFLALPWLCLPLALKFWDSVES